MLLKVSTMKRATKDTSPSEPTFTFRIPCFAHQHLDPTYFPENIGCPVGSPLAWSKTTYVGGGGNGAWEGSDDEHVAEVGTELVKEVSAASKPSKKRGRPATRPKPDDSYKKMKVTGGRPAVAKKITADMDSDDELIVSMKNAKYLEKDIAQRLVDEGRIAYNTKTIGTRWARMKKVLQKQQDDLLDAELTDWHDGDDDVLGQAIKKANQDVERLKAQADAKKWRIVADQIKLLKPVVNFSQNACRDRFESLADGTAKPTPESIVNPDKKTQQRIKSRRDRQRKIDEDEKRFGPVESNLQNNSWTSRPVKYF